MDCPNYTTKIIDFGFAAKSKEKLQIFCGTPAYMSPEICNKAKYDGAATDMWASGILLYTILFGVQPFKAGTEQELFRKIQKGVFKLPNIKRESDTFEGYPDIEYASTVKKLLSDILVVEEDQRITAEGLLEKYEGWFN